MILAEQKKFAVFDIDGTLIRWQLYHVIVSKLAKSGALGPDAHKELSAARMAWKRREESFKVYEGILIGRYEQALRRLSTEAFDKLVSGVIKEYKDQTYVYTRGLAQKLKSEGYMMFIISGSHDEVIEQIAKIYGFDDWDATKYERGPDGKFTGKVYIASQHKDEALDRLVKKHGCSYKDSVAIGDSGSDIALLEKVERPIAFNPDDKLFDAARKNGWPVVLERKNVIYELELEHGKYVLAKTNAK
jgi:HAD superfamily hydrolase (TIGR01490 family)